MHVWHDTRLIFMRYLRQNLRNTVGLAFGVLQPLLYLVLFGPLLTGLPGADRLYAGGDIWAGFVPGMLVMLALVGSFFAGTTIISEHRQGILERMRVTRASRLALLLGRIGADVVRVQLQAVLLLLVAIALGMRVPIVGVLLGLFAVALLTTGFTALSYALGLITKREDTVAPLLQATLLPLLLLSGVFLPMSTAPGWLQVLAHLNPVFYTVDGLRDAFHGTYTTTPLALGIGMTLLITAIGLIVGTRTFHRENT